MDRHLQDLRFCLRLLLKSPIPMGLAILMLALGIGASTAVFSVVSAIWLKPLRFPDDGRLVMVGESSRQGGEQSATSLATLADWEAQNEVFEHLAGLVPSNVNMGAGDRAERLRAFRVGPRLFTALGAQAAIGRTFQDEEAHPGSDDVVVLSDRLWRRGFAADPSVIGRRVVLDGHPHTVVGVMPPRFDFPPTSELWVPLAPKQEELRERGERRVRVLGRLKAGVTIEQATAANQVLAGRMAAQYPEWYEGRTILLRSVRESYLGPARAVLFTLVGAVLFVLMIGCANVANLLLTQATARRREMVVRAVMGARRSHLVVQWLTESMVLALLGGVLGVLFAVWGTDLISALLPEGLAQRVPGWGDIQVDGGVLVFSLGLALLTGLLFGLVPSLRASRLDLMASLREGGRGVSARDRMRSGLVVAEVALTLLLVVGAGLMARSLHQLQASSPGFDSQGVQTFELTLPEAQFPTGAERARLIHQLVERLASIPGASGAGAVSLLPMARGSQTSSFHVVGRPVPAPSEQPEANSRVITPGYFRALSIPLLQGRDLTSADSEGAPRVLLINEEMARRFWPGETALGRHLEVGDGGSWEVVGIVGSIRSSYRGEVRAAVPEFYLPLAQAPRESMAVVVRAVGEQLSLSAAVRTQVSQLGSGLPEPQLRALDDVVMDAMGPRRLLANLLGAFAALALVLAAGGIYSITSYSVEQRTHELGVRLALGATQRDIFKLILGQALGLAGLGALIGSLGALALMRLLSVLLFEVSPADPLTFGSTIALLVMVSLLAGFVPAWRATRVPPMTALRAE
ncbi:ABC transporter permease [Archangium violaceum]|uniref:ABC transporter permease n=1 Tax=Archangium violaceum TaxID=83451 RepID=UPI0036DB81A2